MIKNLSANIGHMGSISGSGKSPGEGNVNPLQYFAWEIPGTEKPGRVHPIESQRVRHDLATKQQKNIFHIAIFL